ncbi:hypothetical protein, partial [Dermacoccus nishinomiyaensis]
MSGCLSFTSCGLSSTATLAARFPSASTFTHAQQAQAQARQSDVRAQHAVRQADEARARAQ